MTAPSLILESLAHHSHAQPLAIEGQKKGSGTIFSSRRLLDVGNRRGNLDGNNVAGLVWVPEFRYGLSNSSSLVAPRHRKRVSCVARQVQSQFLGRFS
jgi:hypothetical protein